MGSIVEGARGAGVRRGSGAARLLTDPLRCEGIGMCAHLAPGVIALDAWGFPVVPREPVSGRERAAARRAVAGCPRRALLLDDVSTP